MFALEFETLPLITLTWTNRQELQKEDWNRGFDVQMERKSDTWTCLTCVSTTQSHIFCDTVYSSLNCYFLFSLSFFLYPHKYYLCTFCKLSPLETLFVRKNALFSVVSLSLSPWIDLMEEIGNKTEGARLGWRDNWTATKWYPVQTEVSWERSEKKNRTCRMTDQKGELIRGEGRRWPNKRFLPLKTCPRKDGGKNFFQRRIESQKVGNNKFWGGSKQQLHNRHTHFPSDQHFRFTFSFFHSHWVTLRKTNLRGNRILKNLFKKKNFYFRFLQHNTRTIALCSEKGRRRRWREGEKRFLNKEAGRLKCTKWVRLPKKRADIWTEGTEQDIKKNKMEMETCSNNNVRTERRTDQTLW